MPTDRQPPTPAARSPPPWRAPPPRRAPSPGARQACASACAAGNRCRRAVACRRTRSCAHEYCRVGGKVSPLGEVGEAGRGARRRVAPRAPIRRASWPDQASKLARSGEQAALETRLEARGVARDVVRAVETVDDSPRLLVVTARVVDVVAELLAGAGAG